MILALYYVTLLAFLLASFFPEYRLWGINWWAYFPHYVPFILFAIGAVAPIVIWFVFRQGELDIGDERASADKSGKYFIIVFCLTVLYGLAFYFLRARTHFLGDGYTALSSLASDNPLVKPRGLGEGLLHVWVKSAIGGDTETAALLSFQTISISAGVLFLVAVALVSKWLFDRTIDRILFWLGLVSSGYMLLFFGYVEYYSLFVLSVAVYSLMGLLVIKGKINRWLVLPFVALAIFFHVLGVTLIPSAVYLLVANSKLGNTLARLNSKTKLLIGAITVVILVSLFHYFYSTHYYFRFAFVPLLENRFTVEGYTLFSSKHLVDYFNLLILLLPGLPLVMTMLLFLPVRRMLRKRVYRYLLILLASTLGAVFIFDPKLGMPRDWDLFSFVGVPLSVGWFYLLLSTNYPSRSSRIVAVLVPVLGLLLLLPRAATLKVPNSSLEHFKSYLALDKKKNRNAWRLLIDYHKRRGDTLSAQAVIHQRISKYPELLYNAQAQALMNEGRYAEALAPARMAIQLDPVYWSAYHNLGASNYQIKQFDSAEFFLEIANGLNPFNAETLALLGGVQLHKGNYRQAKKYFDRSFHIDSGLENAIVGLVWVHRSIGQFERSFEYLTRLYDLNLVTSDFFREAGDFYLHKGKYGLAAGAYTYAVDRGLDSSYVDSLRVGFPQLRNWFK